MAKNEPWWGLGNRVAPPRFILFVLLFAIGLAIGVPLLQWGRATMAAFDVAGFVFLLSCWPLLHGATPEGIRAATRANDANRAVLLGFSFVTLIVILVAVHGELKGKNDALALVLVLATLVIAWLFSNILYALHYAHLFYNDDGDDGGDDGGLEFPKTKEPTYWDFVYFSFTLGMTFQTSDVEISSERMRRIVIGQCLAAFVFNLGVLAFTINVLGGGS
ncbi:MULTISPECIES: DUF1345 domain-containing protein [unclassified Sphingomonas]|uniref:DUF1345 domain-containing protein n=1 Tax=unclassified Sphingomonas TaxID=196159 RepID=UPI001F56AAE8|nr:MULTISPECIES: DUF1345 domain-containing protein [unclassified Sphingomonas]